MAAGGNVVSEKENKRLEFTVNVLIHATFPQPLFLFQFFRSASNADVCMQVMNAAADRASILPYIKMFQQLIR